VHLLIKAVAACIAVIALLIAPSPSASQAPTPPAPPQVSVAVRQTTTTTTTTQPIPQDARCGQWWSLARQVGFTKRMLPTLDRVLYRETRCGVGSMHNAGDPNGGSHGLTQVNGFWCRPSRYYPLGYLQTHGVLTSCADLYEPEVALRATLALIAYSRSVGLCTWSQWAWLDPCED
jgi:hypothetical protein